MYKSLILCIITQSIAYFVAMPKLQSNWVKSQYKVKTAGKLGGFHLAYKAFLSDVSRRRNSLLTEWLLRVSQNGVTSNRHADTHKRIYDSIISNFGYICMRFWLVFSGKTLYNKIHCKFFLYLFGDTPTYFLNCLLKK